MNTENHLPNLFIPGAAKSGTSSLHEYLNQHPNVLMSSNKEPHFFCHEDFDLKWANYQRLFNLDGKYLYRGESSTGYMVFPNVVKRIHETIPAPRFIFILRNPIDRAYSHYWWLRGLGFERKGFLPAFYADYNQEPIFGDTHGPGYKYYFQFGLYGKWIKRFFDSFEEDRIFIITTESLRSSPHETLRNCLSFLDLPHFPFDLGQKHNETLVLKYSLLNSIFGANLKSIPSAQKIYHKIFREKSRKEIASFRSMLSRKYIKKAAKKRGYPALRREERKEVAQNYFEDVETLKRITGLGFKNWSDFSTS